MFQSVRSEVRGWIAGVRLVAAAMAKKDATKDAAKEASPKKGKAKLEVKPNASASLGSWY